MKVAKNNKIWAVAAAFLVTVGLLCGGQALNAKVRVENPLRQRLKAIKTVTDFAVKPVGAGLRLNLQLKQSPDLQQILNTTINEVEYYYKKPVTEMVIGSRSNARLEQIRYQLSFHLEEALVSGRFIQLKTAVESFNRPGTSVKVYLERRFIYLQLETGSNYLYYAVARPDYQAVAAVNRTEGGWSE